MHCQSACPPEIKLKNYMTQIWCPDYLEKYCTLCKGAWVNGQSHQFRQRSDTNCIMTSCRMIWLNVG